MCRRGHAGMVLEAEAKVPCSVCQVSNHSNIHGSCLAWTLLWVCSPCSIPDRHGFPPGRRLWDSQDLSGDD